MTKLVDSLSLTTRKVVMTSAAYYGLNVSLVSDSEFDGWCQRLHDDWDLLDDYSKWQLVDAGSILASGYHVKVTWATFGGLTKWLELKGLLKYRLGTVHSRWLKADHAKHLPSYTTTDNVLWNKKERLQ